MDRYEKQALYDDIEKAQAGDSTAKSNLVERNLGLVYKVASKFYNRGYDCEDIQQIGTIGLLKAIDNFDTNYKVCFSTYAVPMIMGEIKRFLRDDGPIKVSREIKRTANAVLKISEEIQKNEGRMPGVQEIASILGVSKEDVAQAKEAVMPPESFSAVRSGSGQTLAEVLPSCENETDLLNRMDLKSAVASLPKREQTIIIMRYFLEKTQSEVAKKLGISQVQVSRLEKKILQTFRETLTEKTE